jgi:hypothetical protein
VFAHVVRPEVGREKNAESFVDEVMRAFDGVQADLSNAIGSLMLTRPEDGEALQIFLFDTEEDADDAEGFLQSIPAPDSGAREIVTGRRPNALGRSLWHAWQGRWNLRTDASSSRSAT